MTITSTTRTGLGVRGWLILLTLCGATFMTGLDYSIITVALPQIGTDLGFDGPTGLQWVATACLLPSAALLPLFGRVGDLVGRRRLFIIGVAGFAVLSLLAAAATSPAMLITARAGQGVGAAAIGPTALALMMTVFPEGPQRTRALGVNGALLALGFVIGTIGGGVLTSGLDWRATMLLLAVLGGLILCTATTVLTDPAPRAARRLDLPGAVLAGIGLLGLCYGVSTGDSAGWTSPYVAATLLVAVAAFAGFGIVESRHPEPVVPLRLLRRTTIVWGGIGALVTFGMCGGATMLLSLYMQNVLGYSALVTGFGFIGEGVAAIVGGSLAARFIGALGPRRVLAVGLLVQAVGTAALVATPEHDGAVVLLAGSTVMGLGHVLSVVSAVALMTSGVDAADQGVAGSLAQLPTFIGAVGVAGLTAIVSARTDALIGEVSAVVASLSGLHTGFAAAAGVAAAGGIVIASRRRIDRVVTAV